MGRTPKLPGERINRVKPIVEWKAAEGIGWQHGKTPPAPSKLTPAARLAWRTWFAAWFASHWGPEDLPGLRMLVLLYDQVERGEFARHGELRMAMDSFGITAKGQMALRYLKPKLDEQPVTAKATESRYDHLRSVQTG